jgi:transcriptional regulator with XRE-family HTH domain
MTKTKRRKGPAPGTAYPNIKRSRIGAKIACLRRERGISQVQLAEKTGLTSRMISFYERETDGIPPMRLEKIAQVLGTSIDELLNGEAKTINLEVNRAFLKRLELAKTLPEQKQKILSDMIDEMSGRKE